MQIIDKNITEQTRGIFRKEVGPPTQNASAREAPSTGSTDSPRAGSGQANEWRDIPAEKGARQVLSDEDILELSELILKIERHYGFPVDVEWARDASGKFYIVQSRPITTLSLDCGVKEFASPYRKDDYILSFWAHGVSILVTDLNTETYAPLETLCIIDHGLFKQYFTKRAYERALERGLVFYRDPHAFIEYRTALTAHISTFKDFFNHNIKGKDELSRTLVAEFFDYAKTLFSEYDRMNYESTDRAFLHSAEDPILDENLKGVAEFKDTVRAFMNTVFFEPGGYTDQLTNVLGKQFRVSPSLLEHLTQQEILALFDGRLFAETAVFKRQDAFVEHYTAAVHEGAQAEAILAEFKEHAEPSDTIQGQTANKGNVRGHVKIVHANYADMTGLAVEIDQMNEGDILIAETTAPELLLACKKAGAIVTDMGGLMSHAAIVSRELKKPCIIGTKIATQVLHDGDLVEVDADKGAVRVLKRAGEEGV